MSAAAPGSSQPGQPFKLLRELAGLAALFLAVFLMAALVSYDPRDPSLNHLTSAARGAQNAMGLAGAYFGGFIAEILGVAGLGLPVLLGWAGLRALGFLRPLTTAEWAGLGAIWLTLCVWLGHPGVKLLAKIGGLAGGGYLGEALWQESLVALGFFGSLLIWTFVFLAGFRLLTGEFWKRILAAVLAVARWLYARMRKPSETAANPQPIPAAAPLAAVASSGDEEETFLLEAEPLEVATEEEPAPLPAPVEPSEPKPQVLVEKKQEAAPPKHPRQTESAQTGSSQDLLRLAARHALPILDFLSPPPPRSAKANSPNPSDPARLKSLADKLGACLTDFSIQGEVLKVTPGPVVTMLEYKPAPGVKISRIANLADDLALALKAMAVRIEAPIPGKDAVGVEIPNEFRETVWLREIFESEAFRGAESPLTLALGKDISGNPRVADLAKMPHLLVAGATGAGKSVCLNGILLSILFKASPDEVKLLLIDPKRIELSVYADLPHLVHPVVTDMALAKNALDWAVHEMDQRYQLMAAMGVRNIDGYNQKLAAMPKEEREGISPIPYLVLIIDELADLMMTAAKEVEVSVVRLAQLARAAGIHLILATQRPSVDVVTGLIKANFPTRISFQVTSKHDARTILDTVGSEKLLGRGDMLFKPGGAKLQRMHGAFVAEEEIARVVEFWKLKRSPDYQIDFADWKTEGSGDGVSVLGNGSDGEDVASDPMYKEAVEFVSGQGKASISLIQRRFRIGFNKAARLIEQMERDGLLGPSEGAKPRNVIRRD